MDQRSKVAEHPLPSHPNLSSPQFLRELLQFRQGQFYLPCPFGEKKFPFLERLGIKLLLLPFFFCPLEGHSRWRNQLWFHRITHGHLYLLLGEGWRRGEMIMCAQGWPEALGGGWGRPNWGQGRSFVGIFFTSSWPPALTDFDKRRNSKDKP